jgi:hypothetical protein
MSQVTAVDDLFGTHRLGTTIIETASKSRRPRCRAWMTRPTTAPILAPMSNPYNARRLATNGLTSENNPKIHRSARRTWHPSAPLPCS